MGTSVRRNVSLENPTMNKFTRIATTAGIALVTLAGCGAPQRIETGSPAKAVTAAAPAASPTTTAKAAPSGVPLSQLTVIGEGSTPTRGPIKMNAKVYSDSVYETLGCGAGYAWVFDLNRSYSKLTTTVGYDDNAIADESAVVKFVGDNGQSLGQVNVSLGKVAPVEVPLNGALRLRVEVTRTNGGCIPETGYSSVVGLGDATLTRI